MRAERLLRVVHLLQSRGRLTAGELARQLEVSTRTIKRDMEALSGAGIPVYAMRGADGGWSLLNDYRTSLNALTTTEALAILVGRPSGVMSELGLDDRAEDAQRKVMAGLSPSARAHAQRAQQRIHVDLETWVPAGREALLPVLQEAVWQDELIDIRYGTTKTAFLVAPLGLVSKGGVWYLVARRGDAHRTYRVSHIHAVTGTGEGFQRPDDFDLVAHWRSSSAGFVRSLPSYHVTLRVRGEALDRMRWTWAKTKRVREPDRDGWAEAALDLQDREAALQTVRTLGNDVVIVAPDELRSQTVASARHFLRANT